MIQWGSGVTGDTLSLEQANLYFQVKSFTNFRIDEIKKRVQKKGRCPETQPLIILYKKYLKTPKTMYEIVWQFGHVMIYLKLVEVEKVCKFVPFPTTKDMYYNLFD